MRRNTRAARRNTARGKRGRIIRCRITVARVAARIKAKNGHVIRKGLCDSRECETSSKRA